ncbi:hypothetical protein [Cryobacterium psychrophilum]|uniref:V-type ATP synthase subunit F n=1 Tax=Cryobacterium psychrophilum TaxID=41988 RepID=A0A4Y8KW84_9MICO|nr:hypothetical protein [Cryobacterium psychrophilum]TDW30137.1 hypothetical protein EDD25_1878 [Cryobacterium psychrophilum]TFD80595.1 hypothetical protein E3T53_04600 [Cryobacterium psychrophilum]
MSDFVAALGENVLLEGFGLAGASVYVAETEEDVRRSWAQLIGHAGVVILTPRAARAIGPAVGDPHSPLTVVLSS